MSQFSSDLAPLSKESRWTVASRRAPEETVDSARRAGHPAQLSPELPPRLPLREATPWCVTLTVISAGGFPFAGSPPPPPRADEATRTRSVWPHLAPNISPPASCGAADARAAACEGCRVNGGDQGTNSSSALSDSLRSVLQLVSGRSVSLRILCLEEVPPPCHLRAGSFQGGCPNCPGRRMARQRD